MAATVEPPVTLFQKPIKAVLGDAVEAAQMPLGLTPKVFNPVDVMATFADEYFVVVDPSVVKLRNIQHIIHLKTVCIDDAIRQDLLSDNWNQRRCLRVWDHGGVHLATTLYKAKDWHFPGCASAPSPLAHASEIAFVCFHFAGEFIALHLAGDKPSQPLIKSDRRIRLDADHHRRRSCGGPGHKMLQQLLLLPDGHPALSLIEHWLSLVPELALSYFSPKN